VREGPQREHAQRVQGGPSKLLFSVSLRTRRKEPVSVVRNFLTAPLSDFQFHHFLASALTATMHIDSVLVRHYVSAKVHCDAKAEDEIGGRAAEKV